MRSGNIPHTGGYARRSTVSNCTFSKGILIYNFRLNTNGVISTYFVQHCGTLADIFLLQYSTKLHLSLSLVLRQYLPHYYFFFIREKVRREYFLPVFCFLFLLQLYDFHHALEYCCPALFTLGHLVHHGVGSGRAAQFAFDFCLFFHEECTLV